MVLFRTVQDGKEKKMERYIVSYQPKGSYADSTICVVKKAELIKMLQDETILILSMILQ